MNSVPRLLVAALAALAGPGSALAGPPGPEVIYFNGVVRGMESSAALPDQALAIDEGDIAAVGSDAAVLALAVSHTHVIDLAGKTLLPGFVDAHTHVFNDAAALGWTLPEAQDHMLAAGITSVGNLWADAGLVSEMQEFHSAGKLQLRTSLYLRHNGPCGVSFGNWYAAHPPNRDPRAMLRLLGVKIFTDGGSCNHPAISFPYADTTISAPEGHLYFTRASLLAALRPAHDLGYQIAVHAIGDRARDVALDAFADLLLGASNLNRHRIEHNTLIRPDQIGRYGTIGLIPVVWGRSQTCRELGPDGWRDELGPAREDWYQPWRSLLAGNPGLPVAWHMDLHDGSPDPALQLRTFEHLYGLVTRRERRSDGSFCAPTLDMSLQRVGLWQALRMMSLDAAYALHQDTALGTLSVGKLADIIVVSGDPFAIHPNDLDGLRVLSTVVGGRARYCAPGSEPLCGF